MLDAPAATAAEVTSLSIAAGSSTTAGTSDSKIVHGQVSGPAGLSGVSIDIDLNGDGLPDVTTAADYTGYFGYTVANVPQGHVIVSARTTDDGSGLPGEWRQFGFNYSTAPNGADAVALAAAYQSVDAALNSADASPASAYGVQVAANQSLHEGQSSAAGANRDLNVSSAAATYNTQSASNLATYNSNIASAQNALYASHTVNYSLPDFAWPQAPENDSLTVPGDSVPSDSAQPAPPAATNYSGMTYDLSEDTVYQDAINDANTTYNNSLHQAQTTLAQAQADAASQYSSDVNTAQGIANGAIVLAQLQYALALAQPYPGADPSSIKGIIELDAVAEANATIEAIYGPMIDNANVELIKPGRCINGSIRLQRKQRLFAGIPRSHRAARRNGCGHRRDAVR